MVETQIYVHTLKNERTSCHIRDRGPVMDVYDLDIEVSRIEGENIVIFPNWSSIGMSPLKITLSYDEARILRDDLDRALLNVV